MHQTPNPKNNKGAIFKNNFFSLQYCYAHFFILTIKLLLSTPSLFSTPGALQRTSKLNLSQILKMLPTSNGVAAWHQRHLCGSYLPSTWPPSPKCITAEHKEHTTTSAIATTNRRHCKTLKPYFLYYSIHLHNNHKMGCHTFQKDTHTKLHTHMPYKHHKTKLHTYQSPSPTARPLVKHTPPG